MGSKERRRRRGGFHVVIVLQIKLFHPELKT